MRMKNEMTMKEKRFSFFAYTQERKAESQPTFGTLPFARHTKPTLRKTKRTALPEHKPKQNAAHLILPNRNTNLQALRTKT